MADNDLYVRTVEAISASGSQGGPVSDALEVIDKRWQQPREVRGAGLRAVALSHYFEEFAAIDPRIPLTFNDHAR